MAILIVETGMPPGKIPKQCGTTSRWFLDALGEIGKKAEVVRPWTGEELPVPTTVSGAIITGSWSMVTDQEPWSEKTAEWIRQALFFRYPSLRCLLRPSADGSCTGWRGRRQSRRRRERHFHGDTDRKG